MHKMIRTQRYKYPKARMISIVFPHPMDFSCEPPHSSRLIVQDPQPFNAEPSASSLVEFNITPEELIYCRNHGPVRKFDEDNYVLIVKGSRSGDVTLTVKDLKANFHRHCIVAALQVGGYNYYLRGLKS